MPTHAWDRAGSLPVPTSARPRPELVALPAGTPDVDSLFTFMRDAELRFETLRMRIVETTMTTRGPHVVNMDVVLRHPGLARVTTSEPHRGTAGNYEVWIADGETVRTYSAIRKIGTERPVREVVAGFEGREARDLPGRSRFYRPLTALPMETLPDTFVHPAGYLQNVIATGTCRIVGTDRHLERETIIVICDHPRTSEVHFDRPDVRIELSVDNDTGAIVGLVETVGDQVTRQAETTDFAPDAPLPPSAFDFRFPSDARMLF
jgi:outer membrane lipoprotein-sorting protein